AATSRASSLNRAPHAGRSWALMAAISCSTTARTPLRSVMSSCCHEALDDFEEAVGFGVGNEVARPFEPFVGDERLIERLEHLLGRRDRRDRIEGAGEHQGRARDCLQRGAQVHLHLALETLEEL